MEDVQFQLLKKDVENLTIQLNRLGSHMESEQRVYGTHRTLIDYNKTLLDMHQKSLDKHEFMLLNAGRGLTFKVDRLETKSSGNRHTWNMFFAVAGFLFGLGTFLAYMFQLIKHS